MAGVAVRSQTSLTKAACLISSPTTRSYATSIPARAHHRIVIVGGGTAGVTVAAQVARANQLDKPDIAILDPASTHHYQVSN